MRVLPLHTSLLKAGDDLAEIMAAHATFEEGDIVVVSSKAVATCEGAAIDLTKITPSDEATKLAARSDGEPRARQAMLDEMRRMHGRVAGVSPHAILTELKPDGFKGSLLVPTAGLDQSNVGDDLAIGWPLDPVASVRTLRDRLMRRSGVRLGVLLSDSCTRPRRLGVTAFALVVAGFDPFEDLKGKPDLFGRPFAFTQEARADQLAVAANFLMGNADEAMPAAIVRDHGLPMTDFCGWVESIDETEDLFSCLRGS